MFAGSGRFANASDPRPIQTERVGDAGGGQSDDADNRSLIVFDSGDEITVQAGDQGIRFLMVSGKPIQEPVAWAGPIVMNTKDELRQAFDEFRAGTFLKHR